MLISVSLKNKSRVFSKLGDVKNFGTQSLAYSVMQEGVEEFRNPAFEGFIPYVSLWGVDYVLSDPITDPKDFMGATLLFLNKSVSPVFCQISENYARVLHSLKFTINSLGVEHFIDLDHFEVTWKQRSRLKAYQSSLSKKGFSVLESYGSINEVKEINKQWLYQKNNGQELKFMARPFVNLCESDVRYFYLVKDGKVLGFSSFDPMYSGQKDQKIVAYAQQHLRVANDAPSGAQDYLTLGALFKFKEEGFREISLGLSPLHQRQEKVFRYSKFVDGIFSLMYRTNFRYHYRTMGEHKDQYKAKKLQTYVASRDGFSLKQLLGFLRVNHLI